jgi:hypothetical protein
MLQLSTKLLEERLQEIWGAKLGSEGSNEARTSIWVYAALSDFNGRLQARDLVRFLNYAARDSVSQQRSDRLLAPVAIRKALPECSKKKIDEATQEFPELSGIVASMNQMPDDAKRIPFVKEEVTLSASQLAQLESIGVLLRQEDKYYMPEIYREGFSFRLAVGARPKVLALKKKFLRSVEEELR